MHTLEDISVQYISQSFTGSLRGIYDEGETEACITFPLASEERGFFLTFLSAQ